MLNLQRITKSYDDHFVIKDASLSINSGEVIALIAANGAGKTTLLRLLLGEIQPDEGQINCLDIPTKEQLEIALKDYAGAVLVASHDVYFLQQLEIETTLLLKDGTTIQS